MPGPKGWPFEIGKFEVRGFLCRMSLRIRILIPWSAKEQESAVDSYDRKQRISGMADDK
jgi:hypothetical protein